MRKVSIIVPVYQLERDLERCLRCLQEQTYGALEILLLDDGSTDGSLAICRRFAEADGRFRVFHHENHGVSYTRNRGLDFSSGEYVMFVDGDDEVLPDMVQRYVESAVETSADVVIGGLRFIEDGKAVDKLPPEEGEQTPEAFWEYVCRDATGVFGYVPNKLYRRELLEENAVRFKESMAAQEDLDFALSAYGAAKRFCFLSYAGYLYYHVSGKRNVPMLDLLHNQRKMLELAGLRGVSEQSLACVKRQIRGFVYGILFYAKSVEEIQDLAALPEIVEQTEDLSDCSFEAKRVLTWFHRGHFRRIYRYFKIRRRIKRILGRKSDS